MKSDRRKNFFFTIAVCAIICLTAAVSRAGTIIKLNLGGTGPDIAMNGLGFLSTVPDGLGGAGDQHTAVEYTGFLDLLFPDISANVASFSLTSLEVDGPAQLLLPTTLVLQNYKNGTFDLYDASNNVLLSGSLGNSALTGVVGGSGTGALFTTSINSVTGGSLQSYIQPNSLTLAMNLSDVNSGTGFGVTGGVVLDPFDADASVLIKADPNGNVIPEPATVVLVLMGAAAVIAFGRRRIS